MMDEDEYITADIPEEFKALRACLRCSLIKTFEQFNDKGCENCEFIDMEGNKGRIEECTTSYFEGTIALIEPQGSWVAKWQRIAQYQPGMYAMEMVGELPDEVVEHCENLGLPYKANKAAQKLK
eukprot:CAMPEP_0170354380 /NCGR_PEP_ID=MMETSP0117_2-20130122/72_1 /TAXON_ID=400756 /ORGANISM="Durinskia baltica, Strain CSIRO CS-38" /LENGTH=123 /DNA_ID=CAMNT_0010608335 /DNA_START=62 /DNA_END=433 /DNA_ORIENTATION=-